LQNRLNRRYDWQRALNEDPLVIEGWLRLVSITVAKYGIQDSEIYNFDETGFRMSAFRSCHVITGSKKRYKPKTLEPGNTEWVTVICGVSANGYVLPPYLIFKGQLRYQDWYQQLSNRPDWVITTSEKG
jgi:hypothetical protein